MGSARGQRPFVDSVYDDETESGDSAALTPHATDDRTYIILMYQEHARQARQQEFLRASWAALTMTLMVLLAVAGTAPDRMQAAGVLMCCVGAMGVVSLAKFRERYNLHLGMMRGFRTILGETVRADIARTPHVVRKEHNRKFRLQGLLSLQVIWMLGCIVGFGAGAELTWRASAAEVPVPRQTVQPRQAQPEMKLDTPLAPGDELP